MAFQLKGNTVEFDDNKYEFTGNDEEDLRTFASLRSAMQQAVKDGEGAFSRIMNISDSEKEKFEDGLQALKFDKAGGGLSSDQRNAMEFAKARKKQIDTMNIRVQSFLRKALKAFKEGEVAEALGRLKVIGDSLDNVEEPVEAMAEFEDEIKSELQKKVDKVRKEKEKELKKQKARDAKERASEEGRKAAEMPDADISKLESEVKEAKRKLDQALDDVPREDKFKLEDLEKEIESLNEKKSELKTTVEQAKVLIDNNESKLEELVKDLKSATDEDDIESIHEQIRTTKEEISNQKVSGGKANTELKEIESELERIHNEINETNKNIDELFVSYETALGLLDTAKSKSSIKGYSRLSRDTFTGGTLEHSLKKLKSEFEDLKRQFAPAKTAKLDNESDDSIFQINKQNAETKFNEIEDIFKSLPKDEKELSKVEKELNQKFRELRPIIQKDLIGAIKFAQKKSASSSKLQGAKDEVERLKKEIDEIVVKSGEDYARKEKKTRELERAKKALAKAQYSYDQKTGKAEKKIYFTQAQLDRYADLLGQGMQPDEALATVQKVQNKDDVDKEKIQKEIDRLQLNVKELDSELEDDSLSDEDRKDSETEKSEILNKISELKSKLMTVPSDEELETLRSEDPKAYDDLISKLYDDGKIDVEPDNDFDFDSLSDEEKMRRAMDLADKKDDEYASGMSYSSSDDEEDLSSYGMSVSDKIQDVFSDNPTSSEDEFEDEPEMSSEDALMQQIEDQQAEITKLARELESAETEEEREEIQSMLSSVQRSYNELIDKLAFDDKMDDLGSDQTDYEDDENERDDYRDEYLQQVADYDDEDLYESERPSFGSVIDAFVYEEEIPTEFKLMESQTYEKQPVEKKKKKKKTNQQKIQDLFADDS